MFAVRAPWEEISAALERNSRVLHSNTMKRCLATSWFCYIKPLETTRSKCRHFVHYSRENGSKSSSGRGWEHAHHGSSQNSTDCPQAKMKNMGDLMMLGGTFMHFQSTSQHACEVTLV